MGYWNDGIMVFLRILFNFNCILQTIIDINPTVQYPLRVIGSKSWRSKPIFPIFQHSNIPIGAKPQSVGGRVYVFNRRKLKCHINEDRHCF